MSSSPGLVARLRPSFFVLGASMAVLGGCGEEEPAPFYTPTGGSGGRAGRGGDRDGGGGDEPDGGMGGQGGSDEAGSGGSSGGSGGAGGDSGSGGTGGRGGGGTGGDDGEPDPPEVPDSPDNPWIAFAQYDAAEGFDQLYVVKADGSDLTSYNGDTISESDPAWSHDGMKLAFVALNEDFAPELHIADFEAGTDDVLEVDLSRISRPRWSPDDDVLVVSASESDDGPIALYRVNASSGDHEAITEVDEDGGDTGLDVGPTGRVYYVRKLGAAYDVYSIMYDASPSDEPTRVTTNSGILGGVNVHPDSLHVIYAKASGNTTSLIERAIEDGAEDVIGENGDEDASYFAGGDKLAISRDSFGGDAEIAVTDADGALVTRCTDDDDLSTSPHVSPIDSDDVDLSVAF